MLPRTRQLVVSLMALAMLTFSPGVTVAQELHDPIVVKESSSDPLKAHYGHRTWTFEYSPDPGVVYNVSAQIFVNRSDVTGEMEGVVLWSGDYVAADGFLQFYRDGGEVSISEESITHPSTQMDGEWYYPPPFGPTSAYYAELSDIGITFSNGDVVQWNPIVSENVVFN